MTEVTADTIAVRVLFEADQAQRNAHAYGVGVQRAMAAVEVSTTKAADTAAAAAARQSEAYRSAGRSIAGAVADAIEGKNALAILGQHGTEAASAFTHLGGTVGRVATFLSGPWGAAIGTAVSVAGQLASALLSNDDAARQAAEGARGFADKQSDIGEFIDLTTGKIIEQNQALIDNAILLKQREIRAQQAVIDENLTVAARAVRVAAMVGPTAEEIYAAERGGGIVSASLDPKVLQVLEVDRDDFHGLDQRVKSLAAGRSDPRFKKLRETVSLAAAKSIRAQRELEELQLKERALQGDRTAIRALLAREGRGRPASAGAAPSIAGPRIAIAAAPGSPRDAPPPPAVREPTPAELRAGDPNVPDDYPAAIVTAPLKLPTEDEVAAIAEELLRLYGVTVDLSKVETYDPERMKKVAEIAGALTKDLSNGLADAIVNGKSLGDTLVDAFARAGQALIQAKILQLLDPSGDGSAGFIKSATDGLGVIFGARTPARRASGGHVSAGQLYRVNEAGVEGFRPAGSGKIIPLGRMAARPGGGGVTVVQPLNVSFAGAITTPELMAQFKAYADSVGQAAAIGGAAMAQTRIARRAARALPR